MKPLLKRLAVLLVTGGIVLAFLSFFPGVVKSRYQLPSPRSDSEKAGEPAQERPILTIQNGTTGLKGTMVFQITQVKPGGPAERAGLKQNDLILAIDGVQIRDINEVRETILDCLSPPGRQFTLLYSRLNDKTHKYETSTIRLRSE